MLPQHKRIRQMKQSPEISEQTDVVLLTENGDGITTVTLNRPNQYNALSEQVLADMQLLLDQLSERHDIKVVIIASTGDAFCSGHDLKEMRATPNKDYYQDLFRRCSLMMMTMVRMPQTVITRVHGTATAAGCQLVANSDLAVASSTAQFAVSGVNLGLFCSTPGVALSRNLSRKRAYEMLMTGEFIDAPTALEYGLVNRVVAPESLDKTVMTLAQNIARKPAETLRLGKSLFYRQLEHSLEEAYRDAGEIMACNMMFEDAGEGIDAFIEKRDPDWLNS